MRKRNFSLRISDSWKPRIKHYAVIFTGQNLMATDPAKQEQSGSMLVVPKDKGMLQIFSSDGGSTTEVHYKKLPEFLDKLQDEHYQVVLCVAEEEK